MLDITVEYIQKKCKAIDGLHGSFQKFKSTLSTKNQYNIHSHIYIKRKIYYYNIFYFTIHRRLLHSQWLPYKEKNIFQGNH